MKRLLAFILAFAMLIPFASCVGGNEEISDSSAESEGVNQDSTAEIIDSEQSTNKETDSDEESGSETETDAEENDVMIYPENGAKIVLANDEVYGWWDTYNYKRTDSTPFYRHEDIYYPNAVTFSWTADENADYYRMFLSTDKDFDTDMTESYLVNSNSLTLGHLFTGTRYYWKVIGTKITDGGESSWTISEKASFTTAASPRCLEVEGVSNTRDIGGLDAVDGYKVKQGMIYRGGKIENATDAGKKFMLNYLNIQTDLDLRTPGEGGAGGVSPLGIDVNYVNIDGRYYTGSKGITNETGKQLMAEEIRLFADPDNYPIYIHCSLGRDRTGTLVMIIEGLLGVNFNDLMMDYELSVFSVTGTQDNAGVQAIRNNIKATYDYLNEFEGASFAERVENYLLSIGITAEEIQAIRDIMLEEK